jgi:hypothetical protein
MRSSGKTNFCLEIKKEKTLRASFEVILIPARCCAGSFVSIKHTKPDLQSF